MKVKIQVPESVKTKSSHLHEVFDKKENTPRKSLISNPNINFECYSDYGIVSFDRRWVSKFSGKVTPSSCPTKLRSILQERMLFIRSVLK
jgi:hypothetical protein